MSADQPTPGSEIIRQACTILRERADAATRPEAMHPWGDKSLPSLPASAHSKEVKGYLGGAWGEYYSAVPPAVGIGIALWLEKEVPRAEYRERQRQDMEATRVRPEPFPVYYDSETERAIDVARQIVEATS